MATSLGITQSAFDGFSKRPVSQETHLSHADYAYMHTVRRTAGRSGNVKETPAWVMSDVEVRRVVCFRIAELARAPRAANSGRNSKVREKNPAHLLQGQKCECRRRGQGQAGRGIRRSLCGDALPDFPFVSR